MIQNKELKPFALLSYFRIKLSLISFDQKFLLIANSPISFLLFSTVPKSIARPGDFF